jgi:regulatory protein
MTVVSIKSETKGEASNEGALRIELSDGSFFSFRACYLPPVFIDKSLFDMAAACGREINTSEEEALRFASACLRAEKTALQLIARAEQNVFGLSRKLEKRGHNPAYIHSVIARLCELGILDDHRYARLWLESHICRQATSPRRLLTALRSRGIDRRSAETALKEAIDDEAEQRLLERYVQKLRRKRTNSGGDDSADDDHSLRYTLKNEGFSSVAIQSFLADRTS